MPDKIGKYELRGTLGRGAMGTVLDGWDPAIERRVAIKTVRLADAAADEEAAEALERFKREAQAAGRLSHANIVGVFDTGETDELAYIVMEFIEGRSLKQVLDTEKSLPPDEAARNHDAGSGRSRIQPPARCGSSRYQTREYHADDRWRGEDRRFRHRSSFEQHGDGGGLHSRYTSLHAAGTVFGRTCRCAQRYFCSRCHAVSFADGYSSL